MDADRFTSEKTGELVRIDTPNGKDWAFVPKPLPPHWELPRHLESLLGDAREQLGTLNGIGRTLKHPTLLLTPLQQREALRSSSLEGTYATPVELLFYELDQQDPKSESDKKNAWREVANHNKALHHGCSHFSSLSLSLRLIKEMHGALLGGVRGLDKRPGEFRNRQVHVGSDRRYIPPPADRLAQCLNDFEIYLNKQDGKCNPLVLSYLVHYQFEAIHPFLDGNGRIGRVLLSLTTWAWHKHQMPWLYMSAFFDRYKDEYIDNLFRVSTHGDWDRWIEFCLRGTVEQCKDAIRRCEALDALKAGFHERGDSRSTRMHFLINKLFDRPVFRVRDVMQWCKTTRPTAQADVQELIDAGFAEHLDGQKPRTYFSPSILNAAFSENEDQSTPKQSEPEIAKEPKPS